MPLQTLKTMIANRAGSAERFWDREFSLFRNIKANFPAGTVSLGAFVNEIQRGTWENKILLLRGEQISNPGKAKRIKSSLPAAKVHGVFKGNRAVDLETCSGLICLDFDKVGGGGYPFPQDLCFKASICIMCFYISIR